MELWPGMGRKKQGGLGESCRVGMKKVDAIFYVQLCTEMLYILIPDGLPTYLASVLVPISSLLVPTKGTW